MRETWQDLRTELMPGRFWLFVGFALFQIPLQMGTNFAVQVIVLLTCMLAVLPYLGSVLLLPAVFPLVAYRLGFYQQFGAGWQSLPIKAAPPDIVTGEAPPTTPIAPAEPGEGDSSVE
jgi:hypothetical protein